MDPDKFNRDDFQRFLESLIASFKVELQVAKGGREMRLNINENGRWLILKADGSWEYE